MNRLIGILFILIAIAICINIYPRILDLFDASGPIKSMGWLYELCWELHKGMVAYALLHAGIVRIKQS